MQGVFEKVKREIKVLRRFNHPHIIKHFEFIDTSSDIFIVLEYAEKGELFDLIQRKDKVRKSKDILKWNLQLALTSLRKNINKINFGHFILQ